MEHSTRNHHQDKANTESAINVRQQVLQTTEINVSDTVGVAEAEEIPSKCIVSLEGIYRCLQCHLGLRLPSVCENFTEPIN